MSKQVQNGYFFLFISTLLWGSSFIAGKYALGDANPLDPIFVILFRFIIASIYWLPLFIKSTKYLKRRFLYIFLISFLNYPMTFIPQFVGLKYTSAASASLAIALQPLTIILVGVLFWKEKLKKFDIIFSISAFIGILIIVGNPNNINYFGFSLVFLSIVVGGFWVKMSKGLLNKIPSKEYTALTTVIGTIQLFFFIPLVQNYTIKFTELNVYALLYLGIGCSVFAGWFWNKGLAYVDSNKGGLFLALETIFGILFGIIIMKDEVTITTFVGTLFVVLPIISISFLKNKYIE